MNKEYIKEIINNHKDTFMNKMKPYFRYEISDRIFFTIFVYGIEYISNITVEVLLPFMDTDTHYRIIFKNDNNNDDTLDIRYHKEKLADKLKSYNDNLCNMTFYESSKALINIFLDILGIEHEELLIENKENNIREILCRIVRGSHVDYEYIQDRIFNKYGSFTGGFVDDWKWSYCSFDYAPIEDLLYMIKCIVSDDEYNIILEFFKL